ncbi:MAG: hypothetical protein ACIAQZ_09080 [Sedimentisphaeraceae bacterium JB056]
MAQQGDSQKAIALGVRQEAIAQCRLGIEPNVTIKPCNHTPNKQMGDSKAVSRFACRRTP